MSEHEIEMIVKYLAKPDDMPLVTADGASAHVSVFRTNSLGRRVFGDCTISVGSAKECVIREIGDMLVELAAKCESQRLRQLGYLPASIRAA